MMSEEIKKERENIKEERIRLSEKRKQLVKVERELRVKETKQRYSKSVIDSPITWISRPCITRFKKVLASYVSLNPLYYGYDKEVNPMAVDAPRTHNTISIVLPDTYVEFSGKVRVTIEPLREGE